MILFMPHAVSVTGYQFVDQTRQRSLALIPKAWYEDTRAIAVFYLLFSVPVFALLWWQYQLSPPLTLSIAGLLMYLIGLVADLWTTWQIFRLVPKFERREAPFPLVEKNPFMKDRPTLWEQLVNPSMFFSLGVGVAAWVAPAIGFAAGLAHGGAARNNQRQARRLKVQLRLLDLQAEGEIG